MTIRKTAELNGNLNTAATMIEGIPQDWYEINLKDSTPDKLVVDFTVTTHQDYKNATESLNEICYGFGLVCEVDNYTASIYKA